MSIVYKYRDWDNELHKKSLKINEIYLSSPKDFNDPFDCRIVPNFKVLSDLEKNMYVDKLAISQFHDAESEGRNFIFLYNRLNERAKNQDEFQDDLNKAHFDAYDKRVGIFCTSLRWDSLLMWSHYANCHKGFCIGYDQNKLLYSNYFEKADSVKYVDEFPDLKPRVAAKNFESIKEGFIVTHSKSKEWEQEEEYRFVKLFEREPHPSERQKNLPDGSIVEIVLGINIDDSSKNEIIDICKERNIQVFQANRIEFKFKIGRIPVQIF